MTRLSFFRSLSVLVGLAAFATVAPQQAGAQSIDGAPPTSAYNGAAFYRYQDPGEFTMRVQAWGNVRYPGLYEIGRESRLSRLLSLAGGPTLSERRTHERRRILVRLVRPSQSDVPIFAQEMSGDVGWLTDDPVLQEGDVLTLSVITREGPTWRDYVTIGTSAASLALSAVSILVIALR